MSITQSLTRPLTSAITRALTDPGVGGGAASLTSQVQGLFAKYSGVGGMWKFDDMTTLFQAASLTTPVTAASQSVWSVADVSGQGNHLTTTSSSTRSLFNGNGVTPDGVDDHYLTAATLNLSTADKLVVGMGYTKTDSTIRVQMDTAPTSSIAGGYLLISGPDGALSQEFHFPGQAGLDGLVGFASARANEYGAHIGRGSIPGDLAEVWWNGVKATPDSTIDRIGGTLANATLYFFCRNNSILFSNTPTRRSIVLGVPVAGPQVSDGDIEIIRQWLMEGA